MFGRPVLTILLIVLGVMALLVAGVVAAVVSIGPRTLLEQRISKALDRRVSIGQLQIGWGNPLKVEISDFRLGNAPWGSTPDMVTLAHLSAEIDTKALLSGHLIYHKLVVEKPVVVLERNPDGIGNWRFGSNLQVDRSVSPDRSGGLAVIPKNRLQFPVLLDFALQDGLISYRTYSGTILRIGLDQVKISSPDQNQPVDVDATGSYNGRKMSLNAQTQSFDILHDGTAPFGTTFSLQRETARLDFTGTMTEPLDFEGVRGPMRIKVGRLNDLLDFFGVALGGTADGEVTGDLTKQGNLWNLTNVKGSVAGTALTSNLVLLEGSRGASDDIKATLSFDQLDLGPMLTSGAVEGQSKSRDWMKLPLDVPDHGAPKVAATFAANGIKYGGLQLKDVRLDGQMAPGSIRLNQAAFGLADAKIRLTGGLDPAKEGGRLTAEMHIDSVDAAKLAGAFGGTGDDLGGRVDGGLVMTMQGATLRNALRNSNGSAVFAMKQGRISRDVLEKAATDLRTLFRKGKGNAPISCLLGVMRIQNGIGQLNPLRLRSSEATIDATGRVDIPAQSLDITLQSNAKSTGMFALDIPLRISGSWRNPRIEKAAKAPDAMQADRATAELPPSLQQLMTQNACNQ